MSLLDKGLAQDALRIGNDLVSSKDEGDQLSGYLCLGWVYEDGGSDLRPDLAKAMYNYRQAALITSDPLSFCNLARVSMKIGGNDGYADAMKYLTYASEIRVTPEVLLGFAHYYRTKPDRSLNNAKKFYLRAASQGRFMGFFGYSEVARELGQGFRAFFADCMRIILGPLLALLLGRRAQDRF